MNKDEEVQLISKLIDKLTVDEFCHVLHWKTKAEFGIQGDIPQGRGLRKEIQEDN